MEIVNYQWLELESRGWSHWKADWKRYKAGFSERNDDLAETAYFSKTLTWTLDGVSDWLRYIVNAAPVRLAPDMTRGHFNLEEVAVVAADFHIDADVLHLVA